MIKFVFLGDQLVEGGKQFAFCFVINSFSSRELVTLFNVNKHERYQIFNSWDEFVNIFKSSAPTTLKLEDFKSLMPPELLPKEDNIEIENSTNLFICKFSIPNAMHVDSSICFCSKYFKFYNRTNCNEYTKWKQELGLNAKKHEESQECATKKSIKGTSIFTSPEIPEAITKQSMKPSEEIKDKLKHISPLVSEYGYIRSNIDAILEWLDKKFYEGEK